VNQKVAVVVLFMPGCSDVKDLCITREQSIGIHDVVNDQGFAMHYRRLKTWSAIWKFCDVRESIQQCKRMD